MPPLVQDFRPHVRRGRLVLGLALDLGLGLEAALFARLVGFPFFERRLEMVRHVEDALALDLEHCGLLKVRLPLTVEDLWVWLLVVVVVIFLTTLALRGAARLVHESRRRPRGGLSVEIRGDAPVDVDALLELGADGPEHGPVPACRADRGSQRHGRAQRVDLAVAPLSTAAQPYGTRAEGDRVVRRLLAPLPVDPPRQSNLAASGATMGVREAMM